MIPVRLQLKNFMSYGDGVPPLEFSGMRTACLSGDNGAGKSSILDAITWALWGETRAPSEDDVIRLGATECRVLFDFLIGTTKYRVHRARSRRGGAVWELQIWQDDGTPRALSGTNTRETKQKLQDLLRMDYKTFLASAYLSQGRADEFTRATVSDRKKVLADILDLSRYEELERLAKEKRADAEARLVDADRELRAIDAELEHEDTYVLAREAAEKTLAAVLTDLEVRQIEHERLSFEVQRLAEREEKAREYEAGIREREEEIAHATETLRSSEARIALAEEVLARRADIESAWAAWQALAARVAPLEEQDREARLLEREARTLEKRIDDARAALDNERYRVACEVENVEKEAAEVTRLDSVIADVDAEIARFGDPEAARRDAEAERDGADKAFIDLKTENGTLKVQIDRLDKRIAALESSDAPLCDYCGQELSRPKRQQARDEAAAERDALRERMKQVVARGGKLNARRDQLRQVAERALADLRVVTGLRERRAQLEQNRVRIVERGKTLPGLREQLAARTQALAERDYAHPEQERLMQISARLEKLERVAQELADVRAEQLRFAGAERAFLQLETAHATVATETPQAARARELIEKRRGQIAKADAAIAKIRQETATLAERQRALDALAAQLQELRQDERDARREIDQKTLLLQRCDKLKGDRSRRLEEQKTAAKEKQAYTELTAAFGKRGVQALIIENALPEIQENANELLGRMTQGAMQVQILTQREARTKSASGSIETLDIIISDEMGTRPYEMYSGGESFRVNFALRIALSKLLARRAGAPLQTLILDEGFGTQDPRGRESILDAIHAVADDFALILIITHIEELKDQFPTRIEVIKGPDGSSFTVA